MYETTGTVIKFVEEDVYSEGCLPNTAFATEFNMTFKAATKEELITQIKDFFGVPDSCLELNSCGEVGRIDISVLEDENGLQATEQEIALWKKGRMRLFSAIYTLYVEYVTRKPAEL